MMSIGLSLLSVLFLQGCGGGSSSGPDTTVGADTTAVSEGMASDAGAETSVASQMTLDVTPSEEGVLLRWDPGSDVDYYEVTKRDDSNVTEVLISDSDERTVTDYDVEEGVLYRYALNTYGGDGEVSDTLESGARIQYYEQLKSDEIEE